MIPVPQAILESFAELFGTKSVNLSHFGSGREESDGIVYAYPYNNSQRLLKILAIPVANREKGLFCLDERLKFAHFLGENGAHIAFPQVSPQGNLYQTVTGGEYIWVGYAMDIAPGKIKKPHDTVIINYSHFFNSLCRDMSRNITCRLNG